MKAGESSGGIRIDPATRDDVPVLLRMIRGLAEYERLTHLVAATEDGLRAALFGPRPVAEAIIARAGGAAAGFAVFFPTFSTFLGRPGMYLEDLYVEPHWRRRGLGRRLFVQVVRVAAERGCDRLTWSVLDWNEPAIRFYRSLGARSMDDWTVYRLTGDALARLASEDAES